MTEHLTDIDATLAAKTFLQPELPWFDWGQVAKKNVTFDDL